MIRVLSYSTQLTDHLRIREILKGVETVISDLNSEIKIESIFSLEIIEDFIMKSFVEGNPIHLIIFHEQLHIESLSFLSDEIPIICLNGIAQHNALSTLNRDMLFFQSLEEKKNFVNLVAKCLRMQFLRFDLRLSSITEHDTQLSQSQFIDVLGDHLNQAFVLKRGVGLILFNFISYGRFPHHPDNMPHLFNEYYEFIRTRLMADAQLYIFDAANLAVIVDDVMNKDSFDESVRQLHHLTNKFFSDHDVVMSIDMGIALSEDRIVDPFELHAQAKAALLLANRKGHGFIEYYGQEQERNLLFSTKIESDLKQVLLDRKLNVVYQPLFDLNSLEAIGVEALVRWNHPTLGQISPVEFLPIAERINGMNDLTDIVFHQAFAHLKSWNDRGDNLLMSVNISGQQLVSGKLIDHLMETTQLYHISPQSIELEVTEDFDLNYIEPIVYQLEELKNLGFRIAIDDFGIGYSSLHYLSQFPVDKIKIDKSFIKNLNEKKVKILQAMCNLANFMKIETLVEGIETREQLEMLKVIGVQHGQGYFYSPPLEVDNLESFLASSQISNCIPCARGSWVE